MMYLLDTDTLTRFHMGHPLITGHIRQVGESSVATTVITEIEVLRGRHEFLLKASDGQQLLRAQQFLFSSVKLLREIEILPFEARAVATFDQLRVNKKLKKIGRADLLIASIALGQRATLVTGNLRDFRQVPGLPIENWTD